MVKTKSPVAVFILAGLLALPVLAQLDLKEKAQLVGIQVDEKPGATEKEKATDISFIFTGKPSAYYQNFKDSILTIEFYDAELSEEKLPDITQAPFHGTSIAVDKINVNKDIEGLEAQFKDIVRVTLPIDQPVAFDYTLSDDFNVVTLATIWSREGKIKQGYTKRKTKTWIWISGGIVGVTVGTVAAIFLRNDEKKNNGTEKVDWNPDPPSLPTLP